MDSKTDYYISQTEKFVKEFDKMTKLTAKSLNHLYNDNTQKIYSRIIICKSMGKMLKKLGKLSLRR